MKKNKLYTVNKWNQPLFMSENKNLFWDGGENAGSQSLSFSSNGSTYFDNYAQNYASSKMGGNGGADFSKMSSMFGSQEGQGGGKAAGNAAWLQAIPGGLNGWTVAMQDKPEYSSDAHNGFSLVDSTLTGGKRSKVGMGLVNSGASVMNTGLQSGNGIMALVGGIAGTLGTIINNGWGYKVDENRLRQAKSTAASNRNYRVNADSLDDIADVGALFNTRGIYEGGVFNDVSDENEEIKNEVNNAYSWARRSKGNGVHNIVSDNLNNYLRTYAAYGGPINTFGSGALGIMQNDKYLATIDNRTNAIANKNNYGLGAFTGGAKTFDAGGGLEASFMDSFSEDPIGAAIRYNRGMEQLQAQKEAAAMEAAREQEYLNMQQRLASLETQNQGLQAIMAAQTASPSTVEPTPEYTEAPASSPAPSEAVPVRSSGNSNWDYIEDQLRRSGKFNDVQIQGIKYNLQRESGIGKYDGGDNGTARGLAQWRGARIPKDMSLEGQTRHLIDTLSNYDGKLHWIGRGNYEGFMNARTPEEAHYWIAKGYERPAQRIVDKVKRDSDMSLRRLKAFGGELGTNSTDWTNGLLYIDEGGTHEDNPLDGVPMGLDPQGIPNLVEEGETVYNNYVFSDRMKVPGFMYRELGLGGVVKKKGKEMSFADASKKLAMESEQRPNDPISQAGLEASLSKLAEVQETERAKKQMEEYVGFDYACGGKMGKKYDLGGAMNWLKQNYPSMDDKSIKAVASALNKYIEKNKSSFYKTNGLSGGLNYDLDYGLAFNRLNNSGEEGFNNWVDNGLDRRAAFQLTHPMPNKPKNQDLMTEYNKQLKTREEAWGKLVGNAGKQQLSDTPRQQPSTEKQTPASTRKTEATAQTPQTVAAGTNKSYSLASGQQQARSQAPAATSTPAAVTSGSSRGVKDTSSSLSTVPGGRSSNFNYGNGADIADKIAFDPHEDEVRAQAGFGQTPEIQRDEAFRRAALGDYTPEIRPEDAGLIDIATRGAQQQNDVPNYATWMRYAPAVGAGLMSMTDLLGITNKPDYTYADKIEAAANAAGYAPQIEAEPIGNYLTYNPMDIWYQQNALNAQSRATDRALLNTNSPSRAAGLLANGYNSQLASGNLYRQELEYNDAKKQTVEDFNRRTNMFNSQMGLEADMANARYRQQAQQLGLSGLAQAAALRDQIDARTGAAKAANLSNFFTSLGNIGRENFAMNQINNDRSRRYFGTLSGKSGYKGDGSAYGGKIKKRK